jgi:hypothetical protein
MKAARNPPVIGDSFPVTLRKSSAARDRSYVTLDRSLDALAK